MRSRFFGVYAALPRASSSARRRASSASLTFRLMLRLGMLISMVSPSRIRAISPAAAASGLMWPMLSPDVPPLKRPSPHQENHARSLLDASGLFEDLHVFPRRRKPFQCPRQCMPRIDLRRRGGDPRTSNKSFRFHAIAPARIPASSRVPHPCGFQGCGFSALFTGSSQRSIAIKTWPSPA